MKKILLVALLIIILVELLLHSCVPFRTTLDHSPPLVDLNIKDFYRLREDLKSKGINPETDVNSITIIDSCFLEEKDLIFLKEFKSITFLDLKRTTNKSFLPENFKDFKELKTILVSDKLNKIHERTFYNCFSLINTNIDLINIEELGEAAFANSGIKFEDVKTNPLILSIPDSLFYNCKNLNIPLNLSPKLKSIGAYAFAESPFKGTLLLDNYFLDIGEKAFYNTKFKQLTILKPISTYKVKTGIFYSASCAKVELLNQVPDNLFFPSRTAVDLYIDSAVTTKFPFLNNYRILSLTITGRGQITKEFFEGKNNFDSLYVFNTEQFILNVGDNVLIKDGAFDKIKLTKPIKIVFGSNFDIEKSTKPLIIQELEMANDSAYIQPGALVNNTWSSDSIQVLLKVSLKNQIADSCLIGDKLKVTVLYKSGTIPKNNNFLTLIVTDSIKTVIQQSEYLELGYKYIFLPNTITYIGAEAFFNCKNLEFISGLENTEFIGQTAFWNTKKLLYHSYNKLKYLSRYAFLDSGAKVINLEGSPFEYIESYALALMDSLQVVSLINTSLDKIPDHCFENDTLLQYVFLGKPIKDLEGNLLVDKNNEVIIENYVPELATIGEYSFKNCYNLQLILPSTVKVIQKGAFEGCLYLTIRLQEGLKVIGEKAFHNCMGLAAINIPSTVQTIDTGAFKTNSPMKALGVTFNWRNSSDIIAYDPDVWPIGKLVMRIPNDDYSSWIIRNHALMYDKKHPKAKEPDQKTNLYFTNLYKDKGYGVKTWIYKPFHAEEFAYWKAFGITGASALALDLGSIIGKRAVESVLAETYAYQIARVAQATYASRYVAGSLENILHAIDGSLEISRPVIAGANALIARAPQTILIMEGQLGRVVTEELTFATFGATLSVALSAVALATSVVVATMTVLDLAYNTYIYTNGTFVTEDGLVYFTDGTILDKQELEKK